MNSHQHPFLLTYLGHIIFDFKKGFSVEYYCGCGNYQVG